MTATRLDFSIWPGTNSPSVTWQADFDLTGASFFFLAKNRSGEIIFDLNSDEDDTLVIDEVNNLISWNYTVEDSNLVPIGKELAYTLEYHSGSVERVRAHGFIIGMSPGSPYTDQDMELVTVGPNQQMQELADELEEFRDQAEAYSVAAAQSAEEAALSAAVSSYTSLTIAQLKALNTASVKIASLGDEGREGVFLWQSEDHSSFIEVEDLDCTVVAATDVITCNFHQLDFGSAVYVKSDINGLIAYTLYWIIRTGTGTFKLASSFANAKASISVDLTASNAMTVYRHADPHEGRFVFRNGSKCDGSDGAWIRIVEGEYLAKWWLIDPAFAHNQGILTTAMTAMPDGATLILPEGDYPISRYIWMRWRHGQTIKGNPKTHHLIGDGSASSVIRIVVAGSSVIGVHGSNFSGQVPGELTSTDLNLSESCGVHVFALDGDDTVEDIRIRDCLFHDLDSGISFAGNHDEIPVGKFRYYVTKKVWAEDNLLLNIRRQGIELLGCSYFHVTGNTIIMTDKGAFTFSRGIRIIGSLDGDVLANRMYGWDEAVAGTIGINIGQTSMSGAEDPIAIRPAGQVRLIGNYTENFAEHYAIYCNQGKALIADAVADSNPLTAPSSIVNWFIRNNSEGYGESGAVHTVTINLTTNIVTWAGFTQTFVEADEVQLYTTGALPTGLTPGTSVYIKNFIETNNQNCTFQLSATPGGDPIDFSGSQSGVHTLISVRHENTKQYTDDLEIRGCTARGMAIFFGGTGAWGRCSIENNSHIGNNDPTSRFVNISGLIDSPNKERKELTIIRGNQSVLKGADASGSIALTNTRTGEVYIIDDNLMSISAGGLISEGSTVLGTVLIRDRLSNLDLPVGLWDTLYNPPRDWGRFDVGSLA